MNSRPSWNILLVTERVLNLSSVPLHVRHACDLVKPKKVFPPASTHKHKLVIEKWIPLWTGELWMFGGQFQRVHGDSGE